MDNLGGGVGTPKGGEKAHGGIAKHADLRTLETNLFPDLNTFQYK